MNGELGDGSYKDSSTPTIAKLTSATMIAGGAAHVAAATATGIFSWGANIDGCLGAGTTPLTSSTPVTAAW